MAKILNATTLTGTITKVFETENNYVINAQVYDKNSFIPKAMEFIPMITTYPDIFLNKQLPLRDRSRYHEFADNCIIQDSENPNINYVIVNYGNDMDIFKVDTVNNTIAKFPRAYSGSYSGYQYLYQDNMYIYFIAENKITTGTGYICKYLKSDLTYSGITILTNAFSYFLFEYAGDLYFSSSGNTNNFSIVKYNIVANTITTVLTDNGSVVSTANFRTIPSVDNVNYSFYITRHDKGFGGENKMIIKKYILDKTNGTFSSIVVNFDFTQSSYYSIPSYEVNQHLNTYVLYEFTSSLKDYVVLMSNKYDGRMYLFEKESNSNFILRQVYFLNDTTMLFMPHNFNKTFIGVNTTAVNFYVFNEVTKKLELSNTIEKPCLNVGIDKNQGVWLQYSDSSIEYVSTAMSSYINIQLENNILQYNNVDIQTYADVYAISPNGESVQANINLNINGNATFTLNDSKRINVTTSNTGTIRVPITIKGRGEISVYSDK